MKSLTIFLFGTALFLAVATKAQVSVNVNIGAPPMWGPAGYSNVQYYYLPDVYAYYDINKSMFIYQSNGVWIHRTYLPTRYRNYDLYNGYKVVMTDYHGSRPYYNHNEYKHKYAKGYRGQVQHNIGERSEHGNSGGNGEFRNQPHKSSSYSKSKGNGHSNGEGNRQGNNKNSKKGNSHDKGNGEGHGKK